MAIARITSSTTQKVMLDANILMELLFQRARRENVVTVLEQIGLHTGVELCISVVSVDIVMYFVERDKLSKSEAWRFLSGYRQLAVTPEDTEWAYDNDAGDYEDALQVGCALRNGCELFVTLDTKLAGMYGRFLSVETIR